MLFFKRHIVPYCIDTVEVILSDWRDTGAGTTEMKSGNAAAGSRSQNLPFQELGELSPACTGDASGPICL